MLNMITIYCKYQNFFAHANNLSVSDRVTFGQNVFIYVCASLSLKQNKNIFKKIILQQNNNANQSESKLKPAAL